MKIKCEFLDCSDTVLAEKSVYFPYRNALEFPEVMNRNIAKMKMISENSMAIEVSVEQDMSYKEMLEDLNCKILAFVKTVESEM